MTNQTEHHAEATLAEVRAIMDEKPFAGGTTLDLVRHWMMSDDHPVNDWERDFAAAIDAHRIEDARSNDTEHHAEAILRDVVPVGWMYHHPGDLKYGWQRYKIERRIQSYDGMSCEEEDQGVIETPLYPASAILDAVQAERAAIVAWLRGGFQQQRSHPEDQAFARHIATSIERGEHIPQDTPQ